MSCANLTAKNFHTVLGHRIFAELLEKENHFLKQELENAKKMEQESDDKENVKQQEANSADQVEEIQEGPPQIERHSEPRKRITNKMLMRSLGF